MKQKLLFLALVLLLLPAGIVVARSAVNFSAPHFVITSGGSAGSASFSVRSAIGQPVTDSASSASYRVSGGFLFGADNRIWLPMLER